MGRDAEKLRHAFHSVRLLPLQVLSESLMWIARAVEDFGLATINVQQLIEFTTVSFLSLLCNATRDPQVKAPLASFCHLPSNRNTLG